MYRALTEELASAFDEVTPLRPALEAMGFEPLVKVSVGSGERPEQIWANPSKGAFAEPAWGPKQTPHLAFRSFFSDGTIVETTGPREGLLRFVPFWPRVHQPRAGYFYEEYPGLPHQLWQRHQQRVAEHFGQGQRALAPHADPDAFVAMARRSVRIGRLRTRVAQWAGIAALVAVAVPLTVRKDLFPGWMLPLSALAWALVTWGSHGVMLHLRLPRLRPAAELIARIRAKG